MDVIRISDLTVDCVVGVYPHERDDAQPLRVHLELHLDTEEAAVRERLSQTVHYAATAAQVAFLLRSCRFRLLETAAHTLARYLLCPPAPGEKRGPVGAVKVTLEKPRALEGVGVPSLTIERPASWASFVREEKSWGTVDVVHETQSAGIYRLNLAPGGVIPLHVHRVMHESEMVLTEGLHCQGELAALGSVRRWPLDAPHLYENRSDRWQSILCVDAPRFLAEDEVRVEGEPAAVPPEPAWGPELGPSIVG